MRIKEYKKTLKDPLRIATLVFCVSENGILLGMKKRGFAQGKWNGAGGKVESKDKTVEEAAIREISEEFGITPISIQKAAVINFFFPDIPEWGQQVHIFLSNQWEGSPEETDEMKPQWFKTDKIPFETMWEDDPFWLPQVLQGTLIKADFLFDKNQRMVEKNVKEVTSL